MNYKIFLTGFIAFVTISCQSPEQKMAKDHYNAIQDAMKASEAEQAKSSDAPEHSFSVQIIENGKTYATLKNGHATATIHSGGKQLQFNLNGETHSLFISVPGTEAKTYNMGGSEGGNFMFNSGNDKEQMMLFGMKGSFTITEINDKNFSGNFSGKNERSSGTVEMTGEFKNVPVENLAELMKDTGF